MCMKNERTIIESIQCTNLNSSISGRDHSACFSKCWLNFSSKCQRSFLLGLFVLSPRLFIASTSRSSRPGVNFFMIVAHATRTRWQLCDRPFNANWTRSSMLVFESILLAINTNFKSTLSTNWLIVSKKYFSRPSSLSILFCFFFLMREKYYCHDD